MDAKQAKRVVDVVDSVVRELRKLRSKRMGSMSSARVLQELEAINSSVASGNGLLLREKLTWFKHDLIEREIGNLKALMQTLQDCLKDSEVQNEITQEGFSVPVTQFSLSQMDRLANDLRSVDNKHHELIKKALAGQNVSAQELAEYEEFVLQLNDLEERIEAYASGTLQEYKPYIGRLKKAPKAWLPRIAAGLILSVAAAGAMMLGTAKAYAQETAQAKPQAQRVSSIDDQISMLEAKPNKTAQEFLQLPDLYSNANEFDKANETLGKYLRTSPNDIRALVKQREIIEKSGVRLKQPDSVLQAIIDSYDEQELRRLGAAKDYKGIIRKLEPQLNVIFAYDWNKLNQQQKTIIGDIMNALGGSYYSIGKHDLALAACEIDVTITPNSPGSHSLIGAINRKKGNYAKAMDSYKEVIRYQPDRHLGYSGMAKCYYEQGRYREAIFFFEQAISRTESQSKINSYREKIADCKEQIGK